MPASRAYPRERGGTDPLKNNRHAQAGLSPRTRGNLIGTATATLSRGPIPANAGEPAEAGMGEASFGAYPRERGGTGEGIEATMINCGLSPRTRGNR